MINVGIEVNFVYDSDICCFGFGVEFYYGGGDIWGGDDIFFVVDGWFDDGGVEGVRN